MTFETCNHRNSLPSVSEKNRLETYHTHTHMPIPVNLILSYIGAPTDDSYIQWSHFCSPFQVSTYSVKQEIFVCACVCMCVCVCEGVQYFSVLCMSTPPSGKPRATVVLHYCLLLAKVDIRSLCLCVELRTYSDGATLYMSGFFPC